MAQYTVIKVAGDINIYCNSLLQPQKPSAEYTILKHVRVLELVWYVIAILTPIVPRKRWPSKSKSISAIDFYCW
jgi:hypothetical protein